MKRQDSRWKTHHTGVRIFAGILAMTVILSSAPESVITAYAVEPTDFVEESEQNEFEDDHIHVYIDGRCECGAEITDVDTDSTEPEEPDEGEGSDSSDEHAFSYSDNGDGTHSCLCRDENCSYRTTESHSYVDGVCVCGAVSLSEGEDAGEPADEETGDDNSEHNLSYADNGDGTHTGTCMDEDCVYSVIEEHTYVESVCICGALEEGKPKQDADLEILKENAQLLSASVEDVENPADCTNPEDFTYIVSNGTYVTLTKYNGTEENIVLPVKVYVEAADQWYFVQTLSETFKNNTTIKTVTFPEGSMIDTITSNAFYGCTGLTEMVFPDNMIRIDGGAFQKCSNLKRITFGDNLKIIGKRAFSDCTSLEEVVFPDFEKEEIIESELPDDTTEITDADGDGQEDGENAEEIEEDYNSIGIKKIDSNAFSGCTALKELILPERLDWIHKFAFSDCTGLTKVTMPDSVTKIGSGAFKNCTSLTEVKLPLKWTSVVKDAGDVMYVGPFDGCSSLKDVTFPEGMKKIPAFALYDDAYVESVCLPASLTAIGGSAFKNCSVLQNMETTDGTIGQNQNALPGALKTIGTYAFSASSIQQIVFPDSLETISEGAFFQCDLLEAVTLTDRLVELGGKAFKGNDSLQYVRYGSGITETHADVFAECPKLKTIEIPDNMTELPAYAFAGTDSLEELILPSGLKKIGASAFRGCTGITRLTVPEGVNTIDTAAFREMTSLEDISIPSGLSEIADYLYYGDINLTEVTVPDNITKIGEYAFSNCTHLTTFHYPAYVESSGAYVFKGCERLSTISLSPNMEKIVAKAFHSANYLRSMIIPANVGSIGANAFYDAVNLRAVWIGNGSAYIEGNPFTKCSYLTVHGHEGSTASTFATANGIPFSTEPLGAETIVLSGKVAASSDALTGIEGVSVIIYDATDKTQVETVTTDSDGLWSFSSAENGHSYRIRYHHTKYTFEPDVQEITVYNENMELEPVIAREIGSLTTTTPESAFTYELVDATHARITGYIGTSTDVWMPDTMNGVKVTEVAASTFRGNKKIRTVILPIYLQEIAPNSFRECTSLEQIGMGNEVKNIREYAFYGCTKLKDVAFGDYVQKIYWYSFAGCSGLKEITLPDRIHTIGNYAFRDCTGLERINHPISWTNIIRDSGDITFGHIFEGCTSLKNFIMPEGLTSVCRYALSYCEGIEELNFPESMITVGESSFRDCPELKSVHLPASVTGIGNYAFYQCSRLESIQLHSGLEVMGESAFVGCEMLTEVYIPDTVYALGANLFKGCINLEKVNIPLSFTEVTGGGGQLFKDCPKLKMITVPEGITALPDYAFAGCQYITTLELPESLTEIGKYAFSNMDNVVSLVIPDNVTVLPVYALNSMDSLESVSLPGNLQTIKSYAFKDCVRLKKVYLPDSVNDIQNRAFSGCIRLQEINFPAGWRETGSTIGDRGYTFEKCEKLTSIDFPEGGVTKIPDYAFDSAAGLQVVVLPDGVTEIGSYAFRSCSSLLKIWIPATVENIAANTFSGCNKMVIHGVAGSYAETFANNNGFAFSTEPVTASECAFSGYVRDEMEAGIPAVSIAVYDANLKEVVGTTYTDEAGYFEYTTNLTKGNCYNVRFTHQEYNFDSVMLQAEATVGVTDLGVITGKRLFDRSKETDPKYFEFTVTNNQATVTKYTGTEKNVVIPYRLSDVDGDYIVAQIGPNVFKGNTRIESVVIPEGCEVIGNYAFSACTNLKYVSLGSETTTLGMYAFSAASSLETVVFNNSLKTINSRAFNECDALVEVVLPDTVTRIDAAAFAGCDNLESINIPVSLTTVCDGNTNYAKSAGVFYKCPKLTHMSVPFGMTTIPVNMFLGMDSLNDVEFSDTVKEIGSNAFKECLGLGDIHIPSGITTIGNYAFSGSSITGIVFEEGFTSIGNYAFENCDNLVKLELPETLSGLGNGAFRYCDSLESVNFPRNLTTVTSGGSLAVSGGAFYGCPKLHTIVVPEGVEKLPAYAFMGMASLTDISLPSTLTSIGASAFEGCSGLTNIYIPERVEILPSECFKDCTALADISIPNGVTSIGDRAFEGCESLTELDIPDTVESYGGSVFKNCTSLTEINYPAALTTSGKNVYSNCDKLLSMEIPDGVTVIPEDAFYGCTGFREITMPDSVESLGTESFYGCTGLTTIRLSEGLLKINTYAFRECTSLTEIDLPAEVKTLGNYVFQDCSRLRRVSMGNNVISIGTGAFKKCSQLSEIELSSGLTTLGSHAFDGCVALTELEIPVRVTKLENATFSGCTNLQLVTIRNRTITIPSSTNFANTKKEQSTDVFAYNTGNSTYAVIPGLKIKCYASSTADTYAKLHGIPVEIIPEPVHYGAGGAGDGSVPSGLKPFMLTDASGKSISTYVVICDSETMEPITGDVTYSCEMGHLKLEAEGYHTVDISKCTLDFEREWVYLAMVPCKSDDVSYISAVHAKGLDALAQPVRIEPDSGKFSFQVYGSANVVSLIDHYEVYQKSAPSKVFSSKDGKFTLDTLELQENEELYVRTVITDKTVQDGIKTGIIIKEYDAMTELNLLAFSISDSFKITIPDSVPLLGGGELGIDLAMLPVNVSLENNRLRVGMGLSSTQLKDDAYWSSWKKQIEEAAKKTGDKFDSMKPLSDGSKLASAGATCKMVVRVAGYAEGIFTESGFQSTGGMLQIVIEGSASKEYQTMVVSVPVVIKYQINAGTDIQMLLGVDVARSKVYVSDGTYIVNLPSVTLSGGVGLAYICDVSVYGTATNELKAETHQIRTDQYIERTVRLTAALTGELGVSAKALFFSYKKPLLKGRLTYYSKRERTHKDDPVKSKAIGLQTESSEMNLLGVGEEETGSDETATESIAGEEPVEIPDYTDESQFVIDRTYLETESPWLGEGGELREDLVSAVSETSDVSATLQTSVFLNANPKLAVTDNGAMVMVWASDIEGRSTGNHTAIVFSVYDAASGGWTNPVILEEDGTADTDPQVTALGDQVYVIWQDQGTGNYNEDSQLTDVAAGTDITSAVIDTNDWSVNTATVTNAYGADVMPGIETVGGKVYAAWVHNSNNDVLGMSGNNTIYQAVWGPEGWDSHAVKSLDKPVLDIALGSFNGSATVAYTSDDDGDLATTDDIGVYCGGSRISFEAVSDPDPEAEAEDVSDSANLIPEKLQFVSVGGQDALAWFSAGAIYLSTGGNGEPLTGFGDTVASADYKIIKYGDASMLLSVADSENSTDLYAYHMNGTALTSPVQITNFPYYYVDSFSAYEREGALYVAYAKSKATIRENALYETRDIGITQIGSASGSNGSSNDLTIEDVTYEKSAAVAGQSLDVKVTVKNNGLTPVTGSTITICKEKLSTTSSFKKASATISETIESGETKTVSISVPMEAPLLNQIYYAALDLTSSNASSLPKEKQYQWSVTQYTDLAMTTTPVNTYSKDGTIIFSVANNSELTTGAYVEIYNTNESSDRLYREYLGNIEAGETKYYHILPEVIRSIEEEHSVSMECVYLKVVATEAEYYTSDNGYAVERIIPGYYLRFDGCCGSTQVPMKKLQKGDRYGELPTANRTGYRFDGWYTAAEGGSKVTEKTIYYLDENEQEITVYAHWIPNQYQVTFVADGATMVGSSTINVAYGAKYESGNNRFPTVSKTGYHLVGWYTDEKAGYKVEPENIYDVDGNQTLYARWEIEKFSISFDLSDGNGVSDEYRPMTIEYGGVYGILPVLVRTGYEFMGWYLNEKFEDADAVIAGEPLRKSQDHTLYAKWRAYDYTLSFDVNADGHDVDFEDEVRVMHYNDSYGVLPAISRRGYRFAGWYTAAEAGRQITDTDTYSQTSDQVLYAHWEAIWHTVRLTFTEAEMTAKELQVLDRYSLDEMLKENNTTWDEVLGSTDGGLEWTLDGILYDTGTPVTADMTLVGEVYTLAQMSVPVANIQDQSIVNIGDKLIISGISGADIYYTFDGSMPNELSNKYEEPVSLSLNMATMTMVDGKAQYSIELKVIAAMKGFKNSAVTTYRYIFGDLYGDIVEGDLEAEGYTLATMPTDLWMHLVPEDEAGEQNQYTYTGNAIKPVLRVYYGNKILTSGKDYSVTYVNNKNVTKATKPATVKVKGKRDYTGSIIAEYRIVPDELTDSIQDVVVSRTGKAQTPKFAVMSGGKKLSAGKDYQLSLYAKESNGDQVLLEAGAKCIDAGTYIYKVTGIGNYCGEQYARFIITNSVPMSKVRVRLSKTRYTFEQGIMITPEPVVTYGNVTLVKGSDYVLSYENNDRVGKANVVITAIDKGSNAAGLSFCGTVKASFMIDGTGIGKAIVTGLEDITYGNPERIQKDADGECVYGANGLSYVPNLSAIDLQVNGRELIPGTDYYVTYKNSDRVGRAAIIFHGIGAYSGQLTKYYRIKKVNLGKAAIVLDSSEVPGYCGTVNKDGTEIIKLHYMKDGVYPEPVVVVKDYRYSESEENSSISMAIYDDTYVSSGLPGAISRLEYGKDYYFRYSNNRGITDSAILKIVGKGNYEGSISLKFCIVGGDPAKIRMSVNDVTYRKKAGFFKSTPVLTDLNGKKLKAGKDYDPSSVKYTYVSRTRTVDGTIKDAGTPVGTKDIPVAGSVIRVTVDLIGNYKDFDLNCPKQISTTMRIVKASLASASIKIKTQTMTGKEVIPPKSDITIRVGKQVLEDTDYEIVSVTENTKTGYATITVRGKGQYGGTKTVRFKINEPKEKKQA